MDLASSLRPEDLADPLWRLSNLYHVTDENGRDFKFSPNEEQLDFYNRLWYRNDILKARQLGFTTFCALIALDQVMWNENYTAVMIAHTLDDAGKIFRNKIEYAYKHLPTSIRERIPLAQRSTGKELLFKNGSSVSVTTSARGGTIQFLHVSEFGKICARFPEKAKEIVTGSFEAMPSSSIVIIESTAEGSAGDYYDITMEALKNARSKKRLAELEYRLHFYPWYRKKAYRSKDGYAEITPEEHRYFDKLEKIIGQKLDREQRAWYVLKRKTLKRNMTREYPSTPEEAFENSVEGAIYAEQMAVLRRLGSIGSVPVRPEFRVNTFWDLGASAGNATAIWLHQRVGAQDRFIKFMQGEGKGMRHWWKRLLLFQAEHDFQWGKHYLPHDGKAKLQGAELQSRVDVLEALGQETADQIDGFEPGEVVAVPRTTDLSLAIDQTQDRMVHVVIDEIACAEGIRALDNYQYEWDESAGRYTKTPRHNWASNPADAFRQWAQAYYPDGPRDVAPAPARRPREQWVGGVQEDTTYVRGGY